MTSVEFWSGFWDGAKHASIWVVGAFLCVCLIAWLLSLTPLGRDDTDRGSWGGGRSGIKPVTDALNGCQYLITPGGAITPRLGANGKQMCGKE